MDVDLAIIGSGPGGCAAAFEGARLGASVALVEAREIGGVCLNRGCIPSKALIRSAEAFDLMRHAGDLGLALPSPGELALPALQARKEIVVKRLREGLTGALRGAGVRIAAGRARFAGPDRLEVAGAEPIRFRAAIVAVGTEPRPLPGLAWTPGKILSSDDLLVLAELPGRIVLVGGGVTGMEMAFFFRALGSEVEVVEILDGLLPGFDGEVRKEMGRLCRKRGIAVRLGARVAGWRARGGAVALDLEGGGSVEADAAAVCAGRSACLPDLGLEAAGVRAEANRIPVDAALRTSVPSILAVGDVTGEKPLAHVAAYQGKIAAGNALGRAPARRQDLRAVPSVVFTNPEVAAVGLAEEEARARGGAIVGRYLVRTLGKAHGEGTLDGFVKWVAEPSTLKILGAHAVSSRASEIIHEATLAVRLGLTLRDIAETIHAHPTFSEGWLEAAEVALRSPGA